MDANLINLLVTTLGPLLVPVVVNALTWLGNTVLGKLSPTMAGLVNPFLPLVATALGTAASAATGGSLLTGAVAGLAATGLHQAVTQPQRR